MVAVARREKKKERERERIKKEEATMSEDRLEKRRRNLTDACLSPRVSGGLIAISVSQIFQKKKTKQCGSVGPTVWFFESPVKWTTRNRRMGEPNFISFNKNFE